MDISRPASISPITARSEAVTASPYQPSRLDAVAPATAPAFRPEGPSLPERLGQLPDVDVVKVAALKAALLRGELHADSATLATAILAWHRGGAA